MNIRVLDGLNPGVRRFVCAILIYDQRGSDLIVSCVFFAGSKKEASALDVFGALWAHSRW